MRHPQWLLVLRKKGLNHTCLLSLFILSFALHFCLSFQMKRMWTTKACASPCLAPAHTPRNNSASTKPRWRRCCGHCSSAAVEVRHTPVLGSLLAGQPAQWLQPETANAQQLCRARELLPKVEPDHLADKATDRGSRHVAQVQAKSVSSSSTQRVRCPTAQIYTTPE